MILLQILDEGCITDSQGRKVDFKVWFSIVCEQTGTYYVTEHNHLSDE
jgi:ATP-dependent Clp protease ATP-binding subunit ClpA